MAEKIRIFAIALIIGLLTGSIVCSIIVSTSNAESVRRAEKQVVDAQESGRAIAIEADRLRGLSKEQLGRIDSLEEDKRTLSATVGVLTEKLERATAFVQRAITDFASANQIGRDIADTIESITRIVNSLEQTYFELRN